MDDAPWEKMQYDERTNAERERDVLQTRLDLAKQALIGTGYFKPEEVGDDIAPRITELWSALHDN